MKTITYATVAALIAFGAALTQTTTTTYQPHKQVMIAGGVPPVCPWRPGCTPTNGGSTITPTKPVVAVR